MGGIFVSDETNETEGNFEKVLRYTEENPGCHLRQVKKSLSVSTGTLQYQLDELDKLGRITSMRRGLYKYYFPAGLFKENEKEILEVLGQETARKILMYIIERKNPSQSDIVSSINISARSANWHVGRLIDLQIVREIKDGRYKRYQLREIDPRIIITLIRNYYPGVWDK